jgi:hypothetical protein
MKASHYKLQIQLFTQFEKLAVSTTFCSPTRYSATVNSAGQLSKLREKQAVYKFEAYTAISHIILVA